MLTDNEINTLLENKKYRKLDDILKVIPFDEKSPQHFIAHHKALLALHKKEQAELIIEIALLVHKNDLSIRIRHAEMAMSGPDWDVAIARWQYIIDNFENFTLGVYWRQAFAYQLGKDFKNAKTIALLIETKSESQKQKVADYVSIIESEQAKKYAIIINKYKTELEFNIDKEVFAESNFVKIDTLKSYNLRGWVKNTHTENGLLLIKTRDKVEKRHLNKIREDVYKHFSDKEEKIVELCGFEYLIDISNGVEIGFLVNDVEYWVAEIKANKQLDVLRGKDDWLFLANDTNRSTDQFTGEMLLTTESELAWQQFSKMLLTYKKNNNLLYVIANSKEKVYPEKYPFDIGEKTITDQVEVIFTRDNINYINPIKFQKTEKGSYYKTDTHWSDYGAYVAFGQVMAKSGYDNHLTDLEFNEIDVVGDLGSKVYPPERSAKKTLNGDLGLTDNITFHNGLMGTGMICVLNNLNASYKKTVLVFGGSSMTAGSFDKYLSYAFERVIIINLPGSLVDEIITEESPNLIINLTNERYLASPGKLYSNFLESPLSKRLVNLSPKQKEATLDIIDEYTNEPFYRNLSIKSLNSF